jgi:ankyrin repeat protein
MPIIDMSQLVKYLEGGYYEAEFPIKDFPKALETYLAIPGHTINDQNTDHKTLLMTAAYYGRLSVIPLLLEKGADINIQEKGRLYTALTSAIRGLNGAPPNLEIMQLLLENKANPNLQDIGERSALSFVADHAIKSDVQVAELLVKHGADVNPQCEAEMTPLCLAITHNRESLVEFLINQCPTINKSILTQLELTRTRRHTNYMELSKINAMFDAYRKNVGFALVRQANFSNYIVGIVDGYVFTEPDDADQSSKFQNKTPNLMT